MSNYVMTATDQQRLLNRLRSDLNEANEKLVAQAQAWAKAPARAEHPESDAIMQLMQEITPIRSSVNCHVAITHLLSQLRLIVRNPKFGVIVQCIGTARRLNISEVWSHMPKPAVCVREGQDPCYKKITFGVCPDAECTRRHVPKEELDNPFLRDFCTFVKPGVDLMMQKNGYHR